MSPGHTLLSSALLGILDEAAVGILTLCEDLDESLFLRSRLTRTEVQRLLLQMADAASQLPADDRAALPEIDWPAWEALGRTVRQATGAPLDEALWFAVRSLVPATVMWLRVYRQSQPGRFQMQC